MIPDNRDEIYRIISRLIDEFMADGRLPPGGRFQGYAIVAGPGRIPAVVHIEQGEGPVLSPEVVEGDGEVHVSAALPPGCDTTPSITLQPLLLGITLGDETVTVNLPARIDPRACSWQVRNGVLDISCRKT
jgi:hypothetical protein